MSHDAMSEVRCQLARGLPVSLSMLCRRILDIFSLSFVGQLGLAAMAGASLATSMFNVFALSIFVGMSSATTTLTSQAHGAKDERQAAYWLHRALLIHWLVAVPLTALLLLLQPLLLAMGQDAALASIAGSYCHYLLPGMWAFAAHWALSSWLQSHGIVRPQLYVSLLVLALHYCALRALVPRAGVYGAAMSTSISQVLTLSLVAAVVGCCLRRRVPLRRLGRASFARWGAFTRLAVPGTFMMCEWWSSEVGILITGLLPEPATNLAAMALYQTLNGVCFMWPLGAMVAGATRVGAALGAGDAAAAQLAASIAVRTGLAYGSLSAALLLIVGTRAGQLFTHDAGVLQRLGSLLPNLVLYVIADAVQAACSGVLQGCGRQRHAMPVVIVSYYVVSLPLGALLGFTLGWGARGIVTGNLVGKLCHFSVLLALVLRTDWEAQAADAARRLAGEQAPQTELTSSSTKPKHAVGALTPPEDAANGEAPADDAALEARQAGDAAAPPARPSRYAKLDD